MIDKEQFDKHLNFLKLKYGSATVTKIKQHREFCSLTTCKDFVEYAIEHMYNTIRGSNPTGVYTKWK